MGTYAKHVAVSHEEIDHITHLVTELPSQARVRLHMRDGSIYIGTVEERPAVQQFHDANGAVGINAEVRLDDPQAPPWEVDLWLSDIERIERLD